MAYSCIATSNSIIVTGKGRSVTITEDAPNYKALKAAIAAKDQEAIQKCLDMDNIASEWSKGRFKMIDGKAYFNGEQVPGELGERIRSMAAAGDKVDHLLKFWEKLKKNPSMRSVEQLYSFLTHQGIPIIQNGNFLAYKGVNSNYTDCHTGRIDNKPGVVNEMARNKVSDDPMTACHYGFHVGARSYAADFHRGGHVIVCEVDPQDVVCIPNDHGRQKMRVCKYRVRGHENGQLLPSTAYNLEEDLGTGAEVEAENEELEIEIDFEDSEDTEQTKRELKELGDAINQLGKHELVAKTSKKKAKPVEKRLKKPRPMNKPARLKVISKFRKIHAMDRRELLDQSIQDLREYAGQVLSIVGASKIVGGKVPLINRILKVRRNFS